MADVKDDVYGLCDVSSRSEKCDVTVCERLVERLCVMEEARRRRIEGYDSKPVWHPLCRASLKLE
jgi:hypothetical protein